MQMTNPTEKELEELNVWIAVNIFHKDLAERAEHQWKKDEHGEIDFFAMDGDHHNGPSCERCFYSYCEHCQDGPKEPCKPYCPDYTSYSWFDEIIGKCFLKINSGGCISFSLTDNNQWLIAHDNYSVVAKTRPLAACLLLKKLFGGGE